MWKDQCKFRNNASTLKNDDKNLEVKLKRALTSGDTVSFKRLVKGGVDVNAKYWFQSTLLHEAVQIGKLELVEILLQNKADVNSQNNDGRTALHLACRAGNTDIVRLMLAHGANVNLLADDKSALYIAVWRGKADISRILMDAGADVNIKDRDGWMPIHWAAKLNYIDIIKALMDHGSIIDVPKITDKTECTPFIQVLLNSNLRLAHLLLLHGADVNTYYKGQPSLHIVLSDEHIPPEEKLGAVQFFVQCGFAVSGSSKQILDKMLDKVVWAQLLSFLEGEQSSDFLSCRAALAICYTNYVWQEPPYSSNQ